MDKYTNMVAFTRLGRGLPVVPRVAMIYYDIPHKTPRHKLIVQKDTSENEDALGRGRMQSFC